MITAEEAQKLHTELQKIADEVEVCVNTWEPDVRVLGNVKADDIAKLCVGVPTMAELIASQAEELKLVRGALGQAILRMKQVEEFTNGERGRLPMCDACIKYCEQVLNNQN